MTVTYIDDAGMPVRKEVLSARKIGGQVILSFADGTEAIRPTGAIVKVEE